MSAEIITNYPTTSTEDTENLIDLDFDVNAQDSVRMYLNSIAKTPLLKAVEEVELAKDIEAGLYAENLLKDENKELGEDRDDLEIIAKLGRAAYSQMVSANLRLVVSLAKKYQISGVPLLDLIQEGNLALMHAAKRFDYKRGVKFSTAASLWVRKAMITATYQQSSRPSLSVKDAEKANIINKKSAQLLEELGREPTTNEIADTTGLSLDLVEDLSRATRNHISLDMTVGNYEQPFHSYIKDESGANVSDQAMTQALRDQLDTLLWHLDERDEIILRRSMGYGLEKSTAYEIAQEVDLTISGVEWRKKKVIKQLQNDQKVGHLRHYLR